MARINHPLYIIKETIRVQDVKPGDILTTKEDYPTDVLEVIHDQMITIITPDGRFQFPHNHFIGRFRVHEIN